MNFYELLVIGIVALVAFGPDKLPQLAYKVARTIKIWQGIHDKVRREFNQAIYHEEMKHKKEERIAKLDEVVKVSDEAKKKIE